MERVIKRAKLVLANVAVSAIASGCQFSSPDRDAQNSSTMPTPTTQRASFQQLIIKFKPHTITCDADAIARLSAAINVPLKYVRPMSGQACVIKQFMGKQGGFTQGQIVLRQHPDVEWVELDAIRKAH